MYVISHNIDEPRNPVIAARALDDATNRMGVDVYALQECKGARGAMINTFGKDYRVLMSGAPGASLITMIHRDHKIINERYLHMTEEWVGPQLGIKQLPRIHNVTDISGGFRIINLHRVWCPHEGPRGENGVAFGEENVRLQKIASKPGSKKRTTLFVGDQNAEIEDRRIDSPRNLAANHRAQIIRTGARVDWAFVMNGNGKGDRHGYAGSDHPIVSVDIEKTT